jgi:pilus assembly protein CpaC
VFVTAAAIVWCGLGPPVVAQPLETLPAPQGVAQPYVLPPVATQEREANLIEQVIEPDLTFRVDPTRSLLVRTKQQVTRVSITHPDILDVTQYGPSEFEFLGKRSGETTLTMWFTDENGNESVLRYVVHVQPDEGQQKRSELEYGKLQRRLNEMFPNSQIQLIPIADKLIIRGQARDSKEAAEIMSVVSSEAGGWGGGWGGNWGGGGGWGGGNRGIGRGVATIPGAEDLPGMALINLLDVPGEQQVMLKVRIAELTRSALRELGVDWSVAAENWSVASGMSGAGNIAAILNDNVDVELFIRAFSSNGYGKILAEPTLVTISGKTATFISGGEFAVPTAVGVGGIGAVATSFRGFGTQLAFTPSVLDKDRIRLTVSPSFSSVNNGNAVDGIPGLDTRAVATTVDLREGQWLAIAGLIQDEQGGSKARIPFLGDIPFLGAPFMSERVRRDETELVVLVSPELVHPLEAKQVPLYLPGVDVTEPTDHAFFCLQQIEGHPDVHHRSTVWPAYRDRLRESNFNAIHEAKQANRAGRSSLYYQSQRYYMCGPQGYSP